MQATSLGGRQALRLDSLGAIFAMARCARCHHWRECRPLPEARRWLKRCDPSALRRQSAHIAEPQTTPYGVGDRLPNTL